MIKVLVLGGTGAMGVYLLPELVNLGYEVHCTSRSLSENKEGITYRRGNAKDLKWLSKVITQTRYDVIIDFMIYWTEDFRKLSEFFLSATEHYVFLSSYRVYADSKVITEESPRLLDVTSDKQYLKTNEYALLKARQEDILRASGKNWTIVRPTITFSKERFQLATYEAGTLLHRARHKLPVALPEELLKTETTLSWGGDVAKMLARLALNEKALGEAFNVSTSEHHTWQYVADLYKKEIGLETRVCTIKQYERIHQGHYAQLRYDRMLNRIVDNRKVLAITGLTQEQLTPLDVALPQELSPFPNIRYDPNIDQCLRLDSLFGTKTPLMDIGNKHMNDKKKITLNLAASIVVLVLNGCVQLFLPPFIVKTIGVEAQGFVQLAANFTSYFSLVTIALTSMSGRFLTISVARGNNEEAASYYTSIFFGNCVLFVAMFIPISIFIGNAEKLIDIPVGLISDVKLLFSLVFGAFLIKTLFSVWSNTFFIINRLYLSSLSMMTTALFNAGTTLFLFSSFPAHMWYSAAAGLTIMPFTIWWSIYNKNKYLPELKITRKLFSMKRLFEVVSGGVWNAVQQAGSILSTGLDLLLCNLMLDPTMMGVLAVSTTIPIMLQTLSGQIASNFAPRLTMRYAKGDIVGLIRDVRVFDKFVALFCGIPLGSFIAFGEAFFSIWMPTQDAHLLQILSVLTCLNLVVVNGVMPLGALFTVYNKVKPQAVAWVIQGFVNIVFVFIALKTTDLGVFAVAGLSSIINITRQFVYSVPLVSKYLGMKWYSLFPDLAFSALSCGVVAGVGYGISALLPPVNRLMLIVSCGITAIIGALANFFIILNRSERRYVIEFLNKLKDKMNVFVS